MPEAEDQAVREVARQLEASWNAHDMKTFGSLFAEDADFVSVGGLRWRSRDEIRDQYRLRHRTIFSKSVMTTHDTTVLFLQSDVAVARSLWDLTGVTSSKGEALPPRRGIVTHVLKKVHGRWTILVSQSTIAEDS